MTSNNPARLHSLGTPGPAETLDRLRDSVLALLAGLDRAPSSLRIRADQVEIAMDWPVSSAAPVSAAAAAPAAPVDSGHYVTAHMVGVFYRAPEPGAKPFVEVGDHVTAGQQVGIIEAMKLMIPVEADVSGEILEVIADNGSPVEFGDRLFAVEPSEH
jgi:acetyl-CoA carboxylase biotin carboxyl carrier protein